MKLSSAIVFFNNLDLVTTWYILNNTVFTELNPHVRGLSIVEMVFIKTIVVAGYIVLANRLYKYSKMVKLGLWLLLICFYVASVINIGTIIYNEPMVIICLNAL